MKVSLQLANQYSNVDLLAIPPEELLRRVGAQLGAVEEVIDWSVRYQGIYVVKVMEVKDHPNADKLHICLIDDGGVVQDVARQEGGLIQIVCGAPEIAAGMTLAWITPGSIVPATFDKDPFKLEVREIRGVPSPGMLGTPHELGISDDQSQLLVIDAHEVGEDKARPGTPFVELFDLNDLIIDCENKMFTHRPDCFGILGVARELAGITGQRFVSPDWYQKPATTPAQAKTLPLTVFNYVPELSKRFMAVVIDDITIKPSPYWLQAALTRLGIRPINNVVDITNYAMQLTGQPMHAFDYHKIAENSNGQASIGIRLAEEGEKLTVLSGKDLVLTKTDLVVATNKTAADIAGIMGGAHTEIDDKTTAIVLTCASFDMYAIRRSSMRHGIFTDAATRYTKGQSILQNDRVLAFATNHIAELAGGVVASEIFDDPGDLHPLSSVTVSATFINTRLGSDLTPEEIAEHLENVEFTVTIAGDTLDVTAPFWRTDIELPEDVVEEVGRLHGFDSLPIKLPLRTTAAAPRNTVLQLQSNIRSLLSKAGANEVLTYSFVASKLIEAAGQNTKEAYQLSNALSPELQYYRLTLTPSLLSKVYQNIRAGYDRLAIFELGKTHLKLQGVNDEGLPQENDMLALVYAASNKAVAKDSGAAYYQAREYLEYLAKHVGLNLDYEPLGEVNYEIVKPYDVKRSALLIDRNTGNYIGVLGEYKASVRRSLKLPVHTAGFEIMTTPLLEVGRPNNYQALQKFPGTTQDISFKTTLEQQFGPLVTALNQAVKTLGSEHGYRVAVLPLDIYHKDTGKQKHMTFRLEVHHPDRTVTTDEVSTFVEAVSATVARDQKVERI
jgi:phenylalanyl-tRNA synthetase beta chain